jgi:hypothetical protein
MPADRDTDIEIILILNSQIGSGDRLKFFGRSGEAVLLCFRPIIYDREQGNGQDVHSLDGAVSSAMSLSCDQLLPNALSSHV